MGELAAWPGDDWADALDALSAAWRGGRVPGWLFNGTQARHGAAIAEQGMRSTEGEASVRGDGDIAAIDVVHLGTPELAAWYMHDTATGSGRAPALVAIDLVGWAAAQAARPLCPLVDENSIHFPALSAIGARSADAVRARLGGAPGWERALAVTGAVALDEPRVPPKHLRVIRTPRQLAGFLRQVAARPAEGRIAAALERVAASQPWMAEGWRFSAQRLGNDPVPAADLSTAEYLGKFGLPRP